ncbi:Villin-4 [Bienertia sinuspersici]
MSNAIILYMQVPFARSSLNHDDIFILDTESKIFQFNGSNSSIQERAKALEVVQYLKDNNHHGKCDIAAIEDGKLMADAESGEFWGFFGGFAPLPRKTASEGTKAVDPTPDKLYRVEKGQAEPEEADSLTRDLLNTNKCYILDCGSEVFVWMGRNTTLDERKSASGAAEVKPDPLELLRSLDRPKSHVIRIIEGFETVVFKAKFDSWPPTAEVAVSEDGRGKVAALLKRQGVNVKGLVKAEPAKDEPQVWRVNGNQKNLLSASEQSKFYSGDCYIFQYSYAGEDKEEHLIGTWFGKQSIEEGENLIGDGHGKRAGKTGRGIGGLKRGLTTSVWEVSRKEEGDERHNEQTRVPCSEEEMRVVVALAWELNVGLLSPNLKLQGLNVTSLIVSSLVLGCVSQLLVHVGGLSEGYKKYIAEKEIPDDTYTEDGVALFRVQGSGPDNMQAIQVDLAPSSLNSSYCYILHSGSTVLSWSGNLTSTEDQELVERQLDIIKPNLQCKTQKEGAESEQFWKLLGEKTEYPSQKIARDSENDPHLFSCHYSKEQTFFCPANVIQKSNCDIDVNLRFFHDFVQDHLQMRVTEIYNFSQDDLMTEDIFILDCHSDIFVWVGREVDSKTKMQALTMGEKFVERDFLLEKLSPKVPIYVVMEGSEPPFFTRFFTWDSDKSATHGNSFQRKLALVKNGGTPPVSKPKKRTPVSYGGRSSVPDKSQGRSRSMSFSPDRVRVRGRSPAFNALAATFEGQNARNLSTPPPMVRKLYPKSVTPDSATVAPKAAAIAALTSTFEKTPREPISIPRSRKGEHFELCLMQNLQKKNKHQHRHRHQSQIPRRNPWAAYKRIPRRMRLKMRRDSQYIHMNA